MSTGCPLLAELDRCGLFSRPVANPAKKRKTTVVRAVPIPVTPIDESKQAFGPAYDMEMAKVRSDLVNGTCPIIDRSRDNSQTQKLLLAAKNDDGVPLYLQATGDGHRTTTPSWPLRMNFLHGGQFRDKQGQYHNFNAHFPFSMWPAVFKARAKDIQAGIPFFDNDATYSDQGASLFFELDYRSAVKPMTDPQMLAHAVECQDIVRMYFPAANTKMWVLTCLPKPKKVNGKEMIASGMHVVFPHIVVDAARGRQLCTSVAHRIQTKFGLPESVVDCACYEKGDRITLRPAYARKRDRCPTCLGDERQRENEYCAVCKNAPQVGGASVYRPKYLVNAKGRVLPETLQNLVKNRLATVLAETSVVPATDDGNLTEGYAIPVDEPLYERDAVTTSTTGQKRKPCAATTAKNRHHKSLTRNMKPVTDQQVLVMLTQLIRSLRPEYRSAVIGKASKCQTAYLVTIRSGGHRYCRIADPNGKVHASNSVFFRVVLKTKSVTQHCFDTDCKAILKSDPTRRRHVTSPILHHQLLSLFPDKPPAKFVALKKEETRFRKQQKVDFISSGQ